MTTTSYSRHAVHRPIRRLVPGVGLALGISATTLSIVAITTDDVTGVGEQPAVVEQQPPAGAAPPITQAAAAVDIRCAFPRVVSASRC